MEPIIVLAMHGVPPKDFPKVQVAVLVGLHMWLEHTTGLVRRIVELHYTRLDTKIRTWPRTAENDAYHAASQALATQINQVTGCDVIVGFNEFCAPSLDEALDQAANQGTRVVVVTPMMTAGGEHSEVDIPAAIRRAQERHPDTPFDYAWPFEADQVARFLAAQIARFV